MKQAWSGVDATAQKLANYKLFYSACIGLQASEAIYVVWLLNYYQCHSHTRTSLGFISSASALALVTGLLTQVVNFFVIYSYIRSYDHQKIQLHMII